MMMKTLQRTSQCQHSHCCLLAVRELLPLLILETLLRHVLRLCLLRLLLRHLFRLCLLRLLLMHLLKMLLLRFPTKKARQYNLEPQQPLQPQPHLQPPLQPASSSPAALPEPTTTSSPMEPEAKKQKQQQEEDDEDLAMDSFHPLQPTGPPLLPLAEQHPAAAPDLEASRSRSRTHSEVSDTPTISYPDPSPDRKRNLSFLSCRLNHLILRREVLPSHRLNSTQTLLGFILSSVTIRTSCSGTTWASTILCSGWTTPKRRPPTTHLT